MILSNREKALLVIAVLALAIFGYIRFLYMPVQARITDLQTANQQLGQEQQRLEAILQKQEESEPVSEDTDLASLSQKLPTEEEMIPVLKFLDESTPKCDIELSSLEYRGAKEGEEGQTRSLTFAVDTSGSIFDLIDFLQELQTAPRFISVADISLNACKAENTSDSEKESTPTYYIAPPGIPQAKLERVKVEVEEVESDGAPERRVADSFIPDQFDMKVTINAYYYPEEPANAGTKQEQAGEERKAEDKNSEGRI